MPAMAFMFALRRQARRSYSLPNDFLFKDAPVAVVVVCAVASWLGWPRGPRWQRVEAVPLPRRPTLPLLMSS